MTSRKYRTARTVPRIKCNIVETDVTTTLLINIYMATYYANVQQALR